jgi:hypothetical protein
VSVVQRRGRCRPNDKHPSVFTRARSGHGRHGMASSSRWPASAAGVRPAAAACPALPGSVLECYHGDGPAHEPQLLIPLQEASRHPVDGIGRPLRIFSGKWSGTTSKQRFPCRLGCPAQVAVASGRGDLDRMVVAVQAAGDGLDYPAGHLAGVVAAFAFPAAIGKIVRPLSV